VRLGASSESINITFSAGAGEYPVTFTESGLPTGTSYWVNLGGQALNSAGGSVVFHEPAGNYTYWAEPVAGFNPSPLLATVNVSGARAVGLDFLPMNASYYLEFSEIGVPSGTTWGVAFGDQNATTTSPDLAFYVGNGTYNYTVAGSAEYTPDPDNGSFTVAANQSYVRLTFLGPPPPSSYWVAFVQSGLAAYTSWAVNLSGVVASSTSSLISFAELNGTYGFVVNDIGGLVPNPAQGTIVLAGAGVSVSIVFAPSLPPPLDYTVSFTQTGLATGILWGVNTSSGSTTSTNTTLGFYDPNGTYNYTVYDEGGLAPAPASGQFTVEGAAVYLNITFTPSAPSPSTYTVAFTESGLADGTTWSVTLAGTEGTSSGDTIAISEENGTFPYAVGVVSGFTTAIYGNVTVQGAGVNVLVPFSVFGYPVEVTESGLPNTTPWTVSATETATGHSYSAQSQTSSAVLRLPNGTYALSIAPLTGYAATLSVAELTVSDAAPSAVEVTFTSTPGTPSGGASGGGSLLLWEAITAVAVAVAVVALAALVWARRPPRSPAAWTVTDQPTGPATSEE
jgi:hypothetical protein